MTCTRIRGAALVAATLATTLVAFVSGARADDLDAFDCDGQPVCAAMSVDTPAIEPGEVVSLRLLYALVGQLNDGFETLHITLDGPDWFHGLDHSVDSDWSWGCSLVDAATYRVSCAWEYLAGPIVPDSGIVSPGAFDIRFVVPRFVNVPDDFDGLFTLTVTATTLNTQTTFTATATESVNVSGWADVVARSYAGGSFSTSAVVNFDTGSGVERGRVITSFIRLDNHDGLAGGAFGTNVLRDAEATITLPAWLRWVTPTPTFQQADGGHGQTADLNFISPPPLFSLGGTLQVAANAPGGADNPLGQAGAPTGWNTRAAHWAPFTRRARVAFFVSCDDLPLSAEALETLDAGSAIATGFEAVVQADGGTILEPRERQQADFFRNLLSRTELFQGCDPQPGVSNKTSNLHASTLTTGPLRSFRYYVRYGSPDGVEGVISGVRIIDAIPPFLELRRFSFNNGASWEAASHPDVNRVWACVLPAERTLVPADPAALHANGTPLAYAYAYDAFDPASFAWSAAPDSPLSPGHGCLDLSDPANAGALQIPVFATATGEFTYAPPGPEVQLRARDVTHLVFDADAWQGRPSLNDPRANLFIAIDVVSQDLDALGPDHPVVTPTRAWTRNVATLYGGHYEVDGQPLNLVDDLGYGPVATLAHIDAEPIPTTQIYGHGQIDPPVNAGTSTFARGVPGSIEARFGTAGALLVAPSVTIDIPEGFDLASNQRIVKVGGSAPSFVWDFNAAGDLVPVDTVGAEGVISLREHDGAFRCLPRLSEAGVTQSQIGVTAVNHGTVAAPQWSVTFQFPSSPRMLACETAGSALQPLRVGVVARNDYPFTYQAMPTTVSLDAANLSQPLSSTRPIHVSVQEQSRAAVEPDCAPADPRPALRLVVSNTGGALLTGLRGMVLIPDVATGPNGIVPVVFRGADLMPDSWLPNAAPSILEVTTSPDPTGSSAVWLPLHGASPFDPADYPDVTALRAGYASDLADPTATTEPYTSFEVAIHLDHPTATLADVGATLSAISRVRTATIPWATSEPSPPFTLGQCPALLTVRKFFDRDADGAWDTASEESLDGWTIDAAIQTQSPLDAGDFSIDAGDRHGVTGPDGIVSFAVWPGQSFLVTEEIPDPTPAPTGRPAPWDMGELSWFNTAGDGETVAVGLLPLESHLLGNACACSADSQCVTGACVDPGVCAFSELPLDCPPTGDLCEAAGHCDDASGQCVYPPKDCTPTLVYIELANAEGDARWIACEVLTQGPDAAIDCDRDGDGYVDVLPESLNYCGQ